jgi:hypothetical protein
MRHQRLDTAAPMPADSPVAAVWPTGAIESFTAAAPPVEPGAASEPFAMTPAMADVPHSVAKLIVGSYAALILVFFGLFAHSPLALFAITICAFFVAMFFAIPKMFLALEAAPGRRPTLGRFMRTGLATLTGRTAGRDALVQMLIVPVLLTLGLAVMGIIGRIYIG